MQTRFKAPAPERMTASAYGELYEAVNTGRLIAYVGSGLSLVYGNITWGEFIDLAADTLQARLEQIRTGSSQRAPLSRRPDNPTAIRRVLGQIEALRKPNKKYDDGIVILEMVRQAFQLVDEHQGLEPGQSYRTMLCEIFDGDRTFLTLTLKRRLEWGNVSVAWLNKDTEPDEKGDARQPRSGTSPTPVTAPGDEAHDRFYRSVAAIYNLDSLDALSRLVPKNTLLQSLVAKLGGEPDRQAGRGQMLPIDRRSLLCLFLAAAQIHDKPIAASLFVEQKGDALPPPRPLLDPLRELSRDLGVRRYFTTNYDMELENLFMFDQVRERDPLPVNSRRLAEYLASPELDLGCEGTALLRTRADGMTIRSDVNDGRSTAPLLEFAIGNVENYVHIYHHHGRVDLPETMVAADGEYNRMYRAEGLNRTSLDRAYDAMIEGNPILFIGSGLSEDELVRTLRKKVSNPRLGTGAPVFVLRPADKTPKSLLTDQLTLRTKFGIHVIHHGHPYRGARYSLRDHYLLLDDLADSFGLTKKNWSWTREEEEKAAGIEPDLSLKQLEERYRLLFDLDFERHVIIWLLSQEGRAFATAVAQAARDATSRGDKECPSQQLVAEYLTMLKSKLETASLRHELRQIGREAKLFFASKATKIEPRALPDARPGKIRWRHLTVGALTGAKDDDEAGERWSWEPGQWRWWRLRLAPEGAPQPLPIADSNHYGSMTKRLREPPQRLVREVILGDRGVGKGSFLKHLVGELEDSARADDCLILNCCYGQEVDSVISMIGEFLHGGPKPGDRSRREFILSNRGGARRPLIVLAAVDRLFGTDNQPIGAEFDWLLETLFSADLKADIVVSGSMRCADYLYQLCARCERETPARRRPAYSVVRVTSSARESTGSTDEEDKENPPPELGSGYLVRLNKQWLKREGNHVQQDRESARLRMAHHSRLADLVIGREIEALGQMWPLGTVAQEILDALAFIGLPVEAEVLLAAPGVKRALDQVTGNPRSREWLKAEYPDSREQRYSALLGALERAVDQSLLKVIEAHQATKPKVGQVDEVEEVTSVAHAVAKRHRFVLHRLVSQVVRDRFGVPNSETVLSDSYNLSLYAAQRDDAPASEPGLTHALEQLVDNLQNGWRDAKLHDSLAAPFEELRSKLLEEKTYSSHALVPELLARLRRFDRHVRMLDPVAPAALRAAGGVIRGYFSSMNLLGLDVGDPRSRSGEGSVITAHKRRIRRLLDDAIDSQAIRTAARSTGTFRAHLCAQVLETRALVTGEDFGDPGRKRQLLMNEQLKPFATCSPRGVDNVEQQLSKMIREASRLVGTNEVVPLWASLSGWSSCPKANDESNTRLSPFYDEEIVWLLNERAMLSLAQGDLYTAATTFNLAFKVNRSIEGDRYHPNRCRLQLNRALLWIERGRIVEARRSLTELRAAIGSTVDALKADGEEGRLVRALTTGFLGLCDQLNGLTRSADAHYRRALAELSALRQSRATALFEFHRGTLHFTGPDMREESAACFSRALEAVGGGRHTDLLYRIRVADTMNRFHLNKIAPADALAILRAAVDYGDQLDMHRIAVEALSASAQLRLELGDIDSAASDCARAVARASQFGMTLRRIWLRGLTGTIYEKRGDVANARFIYERAIEAAERVGYQRAMEMASMRLMLLPDE